MLLPCCCRAAAVPPPCLPPTPLPCLPPVPQPALFLPHSGIRSLELMRAGGTSSTFDLVVHCRSGAVHEFGMISRSEVAGIEGGVLEW